MGGFLKKHLFLGVLIITVISFQACDGFRATKFDEFSGSSFQSAVCSPPAVLNAQRLTKLEYNNVIRDLFGLKSDFAANFTAPAAGSAGFTTESSAQNLSPDVVNDFFNGATAVTAALFAMNPNPLLANCNSGDTCAKTIITSLGLKAFRRPLTTDEVNQLFSLYQSANSSVITDGLQLAVMGILLSPQFIFRTYNIPDNSPYATPLTDYELASRLSFFIWGSIPDNTLLSLAAARKLKDPTTLETQARRMLADPKASYIAATFGYQWAGLSKFDTTILDTTRFPTWNSSTQASMKNETLTFLNHLVSDDNSAMDLITANYTYMDQNESQIYGVSGINSSQFVKVPLDSHRMGIMSQPAILSMNSVSDHTSPVRRGKWVLDRILCSAPGAPPMGVPALPAGVNGDLQDESNIRQKLAVHRSLGASCFACHSVMDPVGLTFENFDSMGFFRSQYINGVAVDSSGQLPTGENFKNYMDLANYLKTDSRFPVCFSAKLASFAQGRDMTSQADRCGVQSVATDSVRTDKKFSDVVVDIVLQNNFLNRIVGY